MGGNIPTKLTLYCFLDHISMILIISYMKNMQHSTQLFVSKEISAEIDSHACKMYVLTPTS